jgi:hemolysin-activating ACP:hemolysin acyltransferase
MTIWPWWSLSASNVPPKNIWTAKLFRRTFYSEEHADRCAALQRDRERLVRNNGPIISSQMGTPVLSPPVAGEALRPTMAPALRLFRPDKGVAALGLVVNYLMNKPAFANQPFGHWARVLVGSINRGHYFFVVDAENRVTGFVGWALTTKEKADAWLLGRRNLSSEDSKIGDCVVVNAWSADTTEVHNFLMRQARSLGEDKAFVYFKRHYSNGTTKPVCLRISHPESSKRAIS